MLKKELRKVLMETKESKERQLIEEKIINGRISMIFENVKTKKDFDNLPKEKKVKLLRNFINEVSFLEENQLLSESFLDSLKTFFGNSFADITQTLMEPIVKGVLTKLGFGNGVFKNMFVSFLTSRPSDLIRAFGDCKLMTTLIVRSFIEAEVMFLQQEANLDGMALNFVRNKLGSMAEDTRFVKMLEEKFSGAVCSTLDSAKRKTEDIIDKMKNSSSLIPGQ